MTILCCFSISTARRKKRGTADVPGYLVEMIDDQKLKDPCGFPDDSVIYRKWKAIITEVGTIKQASVNVETRTRSVEAQNQGLVNDINKLAKLLYVQEQNKDKFDIVSRV
jgi:hypothetical protein